MEALAAGLLLPYFGWGIYTLQRRYRYYEEWPLSIEAATVGGAFVSAAFFVLVLQRQLADDPVFFAFGILALVVSTAALYGPTVISCLARVIVSAVVNSHDTAPDRPRLGPAEALEGVGDFEGAAQEYYVLSRLYPRNPSVAARLARCHSELGQPSEAAAWFERALKLSNDPDTALLFYRRCSELYRGPLKLPDKAQAVRDRFLARFEGSDAARTVDRISPAIREAPEAAPPVSLSRLDDAPLDVAKTVPTEDPPARDASQGVVPIGLEAVSDSTTPLQALPETQEEPPERDHSSRLPTLESLGGD